MDATKDLVTVEVISDYRDKEQSKIFFAKNKTQFKCTKKRADELVKAGKVKLVKAEKEEK